MKFDGLILVSRTVGCSCTADRGEDGESKLEEFLYLGSIPNHGKLPAHSALASKTAFSPNVTFSRLNLHTPETRFANPIQSEIVILRCLIREAESNFAQKGVITLHWRIRYQRGLQLPQTRAPSPHAGNIAHPAPACELRPSIAPTPKGALQTVSTRQPDLTRL
ncbi:hypothetical protein N7490_009023 [Penicillium lividum]|nr:hypothetical protein N7490_009023 [Penicillium lividum]